MTGRNVDLGFCPRCKVNFDYNVKPIMLGGICWCQKCVIQIEELGAAARKSIIDEAGAIVVKLLQDRFRKFSKDMF